ncbi:hypothetical protein NDU88_002315 [Pleurodeles waltl]|uniref:Uncharacterized protein n=1 Tax=Pleurodeles waltl TaxID=8319 RepID=A0AAV7TL98_PLEWA|nr:hypothetical protein NDU88_002315 [Pleurodeles waltl]
MARVSGERAPAFTSEELEKLVDGVLPQYTLLYGPPDKQHLSHNISGTSGACSHRNLECTGHQGSQCGTEPQHRQSPTCEASEVGQCLAGEGENSSHQSRSQGFRWSVESAVTPSKVGKGHKKPDKSGKSSTAEKTTIISAAQEATVSTSPAAQEATTSTSPAAQDRTASTSPAAQEATTSTSPAAQEATASTSQAAQEATASTSPAAQDRTASTSLAAQEATASTSPAAQDRTASTSPAAQEASTIPAAQEATASTSPAAQEATASTSPTGP